MPTSKQIADNAAEMIVIGTGISKYRSKDERNIDSLLANTIARIKCGNARIPTIGRSKLILSSLGNSFPRIAHCRALFKDTYGTRI